MSLRQATYQVASRALVLGIFAVSALAGPLRVEAQSNSNPSIVPPQSNPHGNSYAEWSAKWWQWALGQPTPTNPLLDTTGAHCTAGQSGQVWFLAGTFNVGTVTRSCTVPTGTMLFLPVANAFCSAEGTADQMRACAKGIMDGATNVRAEVDGVPIHDLQRYRVQSPIFDLTLPADNIFGAPAGVYSPTASDGVYLMLAPLSRGQHTVHVHAEFPGPSVVDVTYNLTVGR